MNSDIEARTHKIWQNLWKNQLRITFWQNNRRKEKGGHWEEFRRLPKCSFFSDHRKVHGSGTAPLGEILEWNEHFCHFQEVGPREGKYLRQWPLALEGCLIGSPPLAPALWEPSLPLLLAFDLTHWCSRERKRPQEPTGPLHLLRSQGAVQ